MTAGSAPNQFHDVCYDDTYPTCDECRATLLIYSTRMSPDEITDYLQIAPSRIVHQGMSQSGDHQTRTLPRNGWFLTSASKVESKDLRRHVDYLLKEIRPVSERLLALQKRPGVSMTFQCVWWSMAGQGGPTLWPRQMRTLADLNLEFALEIGFFGQSSIER